MNMKRISLIFALSVFAVLSIPAQSKDYKLSSPSGELKLTVSVTDSTKYSLEVKGVTVLKDCPLAMILEDGTTLGVGSKVRKNTRGSRSEFIDAPLYRQVKFEADYNYLRLSFEDDYILQFRAYNDGIAYRFITSFPENVTVKNELVEFRFPDNYPLVIPMVPKREDRYETSFEAPYTHTTLGTASEDLGFLPCLVRVPEVGNIMLMESDVEDYPGMFIKQTSQGIIAEFPPLPTQTAGTGYQGVNRPEGYGDNIAKTRGSRSYPWRIAAYAAEDKDLPTNNMVYQMASASRLDDISWIKPGKSSWDWWNAFNLYGVDFRAGVNTETYKYHIDFAEKYGLEYVILDDGWYKNYNPMTCSDNVDIRELCSYAQEAGVELILWVGYSHFLNNLEEICSYYSSLGVAGFKIDFFDGQHQGIVQDVYHIAEVTSRYKLIVDLHGIYKPTGINRTYPNVVNFEGVYGLENCKWAGTETDMPANQVSIPFLRMASGPVDFTPGAMRNGTQYTFRTSNDWPMSMGTRANQVAMYIVYDAPLVMLCDSPSEYIKDGRTVEFISSLPVVFDSTDVISGRIGEHIVMHRKKGDNHYVAAMTNWSRRDITLSTSFLPEGDWTMTIFRDGPNADRLAQDYKIETLSVNPDSIVNVHLAPGGGFAAVFSPVISQIEPQQLEQN